MKTAIQFIGTNDIFADLRGKTFAAEIMAISAVTEDSNLHVITTPDSEYLFDIKDTKVLDFVVLHGILQNKDSVGRVAIQLSWKQS